MKTLLALTLLVSGAANAWDFNQNTDGTWVCPSYCTGYHTTDPAHTVNLVNVNNGTVQYVNGVWQQSHTFTVNVDGVNYQKVNGFSPFTVNGVTFDVRFYSVKGCTVNRPCYHNYATGGTISP